MMPFGRGFGFRGWSPGWPYVGLGRGGLPRCWGFGGYGPYGDIWDAPYSQPYGFEAYPYGPSPYGWGDPYGYGYAPYGPMYQGYPNIPNPWGDPYGPPVMTAEAEMEWLKDQAGSIRQEIDQIKARVSELEKE
jgi:hypothetical protein